MKFLTAPRFFPLLPLFLRNRLTVSQTPCFVCVHFVTSTIRSLSLCDFTDWRLRQHGMWLHRAREKAAVQGLLEKAIHRNDITSSLRHMTPKACPTPNAYCSCPYVSDIITSCPLQSDISEVVSFVFKVFTDFGVEKFLPHVKCNKMAAGLAFTLTPVQVKFEWINFSAEDLKSVPAFALRLS